MPPITIAPSVSCSYVDALNTPSSKLPLSPTVSRFLQPVQVYSPTPIRSPVLSAAVIGVTVDVYMKQPDLSTVLKLKSFVVMDVRHETEGDAYRQLIAPGGGAVDEDSDWNLLQLDVKGDGAAGTMNVDVTLDRFTAHLLVPSILASITLALEVTQAILTMLDVDNRMVSR